MTQPLLTPERLKLISELNYHPGFLLLLDYLQKDLDDLADELARQDDDKSALAKLRHWQAFRKIVQTLRTVPQNFEHQLSPTDRALIDDLALTQLAPREFNGQF